MAIENRALTAFVGQIQTRFVLAQVLIQREGAAFELRHNEDATSPASELELVTEDRVRELAQFTASGAYRPLKSAPNLRTGWHHHAASATALESALNRLYPGAVADWFAARAPQPPASHFREVAARQSGMYRIAAMLTDEHASAVARACCAARFCLKQRLWTTPCLPSESREGKSAIPCLEPCALLLELARKAMRLEQADRSSFLLGPEEAETLRVVLSAALAAEPVTGREGDISSPANPRRIQLLLDRLNDAGPRADG